MNAASTVTTVSMRIMLSAIPLWICPAAAQSTGRLTLAVNEGSSGCSTPDQIVENCRPLADALGRALKVGVIVDPVHFFPQRFATRGAERRAIFEHIEEMYDRQRRHASTGNLASVELERHYPAARMST